MDDDEDFVDREAPDASDVDDDDDSVDTIECPNCGRAVYADAEVCPDCGTFVKSACGRSSFRNAAITIVVLLVVIAYFLFGG